jgi:hypothetical protein
MDAPDEDVESSGSTDRPEPIRLAFAVDRSAEVELAERAERMTRKGQPFQLEPLTKSVQFLRGIGSRATISLPAFYMFCAADVHKKAKCSIDGFAGVVMRSYLNFSSLSTIALCTRKAFDHDGGKGANLTGRGFARTSDQVLEAHAAYWAKQADRPIEDALSALLLLRRLFDDCSKTDTALLTGESSLGKRIGLLKQYADRNAAHLSFDDYAVSPLDCAHVVATLVLVGEVIRSFDDSTQPQRYYNDLDEASARAATQLFPDTQARRLFQHFSVEMQARSSWKFGIDVGLELLHRQLPHATGWY